MSYTIEEIRNIIAAGCVGPAGLRVDGLLTDSRSLSFPESTLFFALRTSRNDGHRYIPSLYRRGVRGFVVEELPEHPEEYSEAAFLTVLDTRQALQTLAAYCRSQLDIPVVGITGSNGKTVVKEWLHQLLSPSFRVVRSPRSYNSQIGVPLSVWLLDGQTQLGLFEAGISEAGEMDALQQMIRPTIGVLTNIGAAHQENFLSMKEKCLEKMKLFRSCEVLIYNADDALVRECVAEAGIPGRLMAWSTRDATQPLYIKEVSKGEDSIRVIYVYNGEEADYRIPFIDGASLENSLHCLAVCLCLHLQTGEIRRRMEVLEPVAMRLEVKEGRRGCLLINDSYNSDVHSLDIALDFMNRRPDPKGRRHTLILSDILQTGQSPRQLYRQVAHLLECRNVDRLIGVGEEMPACRDLFGLPAYFFRTTEELLASDVFASLADEMILIKGSRQFRFEQITEQLELKVHETILEVNLNALRENVNYYRSFMKPETKMVCMIKASGYGTGALEVGKTLQDCGVDYLAVAVADEGAELRRGGITGNILIMNPEMTTFKTLFDYKLEPEVYSFALLEALIRAAEKEGVSHFPVHIKLDTGMHRLGFDPEHDMPRLIGRLQQQTALLPRSVFSHFVGSDSAGFDDFSALQFERFEAGSRQLQAAFPHRILRHICNS